MRIGHGVLTFVNPPNYENPVDNDGDGVYEVTVTLDSGVPYLVGGADAGGYRDVISPPDETPLCKGDVLMLDTGATWDGYYCDFDRNFAISAAGDPAKGKQLYNRCSSCHAIIKDGEVLVKGGITGPNLYGVVGRIAGTEYDYLNGSERLPIGMFTDDMIRAGQEGLVWTEENVASYSEDPVGFIQDYLGDETFCMTYGDGVSDINISESIKFHKKQKFHLGNNFSNDN